MTNRYARPGPRLRVGEASLGWAILGASARAQNFVIPAIRQQPPAPGTDDIVSAWVVALYSHHEQHARTFGDANQIPQIYPNLSDLLQRHEIRCVYVCSHPRHHFPLVMAALASGKHVLCETPLALSLNDAETMRQAAASRGLLLGVAYQHRADPAVQQVQTLLAEGAIGDLLGGRISNVTLLHPNQQGWRLKAQGGGVLLHRTIHDIDLLRFLLHDEVAEIFAISTQQILGDEPSGVCEEDVLAYVQMADQKLTFQLHDSFFIPHQPTTVELYGATGALQIHHWFGEQEASRLLLVRNGIAQAISLTPSSADWWNIRHFNHAVWQDTPPLATAEDGVRNLAAVLAARQSIQSQRPVKLQADLPIY
ncbi:MAG: Gfo/Idh/MocA family oxidoreductase [Caldilineaceae bacterium]